jgi:hypothetical protein
MIYFGRDEATKLIKIGFTTGEGEDRLRDLQTGCPGPLVLLLQMEGLKQDETAWHERFASVRERGEWFRPAPELLLAITEAKVSQLEAENARLQAKLDAETERWSVARGQLGSLWASLHGRPVGRRSGFLHPAEVSPLEVENARLQDELQAERDSRASLAVAIGNIRRTLEGKELTNGT